MKREFLAVGEIYRERSSWSALVFIRLVRGLLVALPLSGFMVQLGFGQQAGSAADLTELFAKAHQAYSEAKTLKVRLHHTCRYPEQYNESLRKSGAKGPISPPNIQGDYKFFAKGEKFRWDANSWHEDGAMVNDCSGAWNGKNWQLLDRSREVGHVLNVKSTRSGSQEGAGFIGFPYQYAFSFLSPNFKSGAASPKEIIEELPETRMSFGKMADPLLWSEFLQSSASVEIENDEILGKNLIVVKSERGYFPDRLTRAGWKVYFDPEHITFPMKVERYDAENSEIISKLEVVGPLRKVGRLDVPEAFRLSSYNSSLGIEGPFRVEDFTGISFSVGEEIDDELFGFDASTVSRVKDLDSGKTIIVE